MNSMPAESGPRENPASWAARIRWILNPRAGWVLAGVLAGAGHAAWWFGLSPESPPLRPPPPASAEVVYCPPVTKQDVPPCGPSGARAVWSAAIFALPSPVGFSGPALTNGVGARPPLATPDEPPIFADREAREAEPAAARLGQKLDASVAALLEGHRVRLEEPRAFDSPAGAVGGSVQVELSGGLAGQRFENTDVPDDPLVRGDKAWEVGAYVETDAEGRVRHVFWETPPPSTDLNLFLVGVLSRWRLQEKAARSGRVALRYAPSRISFQVSRGGGEP